MALTAAGAFFRLSRLAFWSVAFFDALIYSYDLYHTKPNGSAGDTGCTAREGHVHPATFPVTTSQCAQSILSHRHVFGRSSASSTKIFYEMDHSSPYPMGSNNRTSGIDPDYSVVPIPRPPHRIRPSI
jgi:hypothetical protein